MNHWQQKFTIFFVTSILLVTTTSVFATKSNDEIQEEIEQNKKIITEKKQEERSILHQLGKLRKTIYTAQTKFNHAYKKYNAYQKDIEILEINLKKDRQFIMDMNQSLNNKLVELYKEQYSPLIELIFNSSSFSDMLANVYYYEKIISYELRTLKDAQYRIAKYKQDLNTLKQNKASAEKLKNTILSQRNNLKRKRREYQSNLTLLRSELKAFERRNNVLREESSQLSQYINKRASKKTKQYHGTGTYLRPAGGYISSRYGLRLHPIFRKRRMHNGIDFAAPRGYRIRATDSGVVSFAGMKKGYGNVTIISHGWEKGKEISSLYAHQWRIIVKKGEKVTKGQLIGYIGSTGYSTGPHLHFEIRENGQPVNPSKYLRI